MPSCDVLKFGGCQTISLGRAQSVSNSVALLIGVRAGDRCHLCPHHAQIDECSLKVKGVCANQAKECWNGRHVMPPLFDWHCQIAAIDDRVAGSLDQLDGTTTARICRKCKRWCELTRVDMQPWVCALRRVPIPPDLSRQQKYAWVDLRAGIQVHIEQCEQEDVEFIFGLPEGACPGWLSVKYNAAPFRIFFVLTVNGKIVSLASVKEGKSQRRKDIWLLDGLYTLLETDGVRYRGVFFLAARLIDHVLQRALAWGARSVQIVAQHKSVANDCKRVGGIEMRKIWGGSEWDIDLQDNGFLQYGNACAAPEATAAAAAQPALATAAAAQAATPVTNDATSASSVAAVAEVTASVAPASDDTSVSTAAVRTRGRGKKKGAQVVRKERAPVLNPSPPRAKKKKKKVAAKQKARLVARSLPRLPTASKSDGVYRRIKRRCWLSPVPTRSNARSGFCLLNPCPLARRPEKLGAAR